MLLCKKIKIEVSTQDAQALEFMQGKCRGLYNWWVMRLRDGERWNFAEAKRSLQESKQYDPEINHVYGKLLHEVYYRLDHAMTAFFRRVENGEKPGFPRVRPRHCFFTLCYPAMYIKIKGDRFILPTGGGERYGPKTYLNVIARLTETPPESFKEVAISRDGRGEYYASFPTQRSTKTCNTSGVVAFDLGIKTLATGVNEHGRFYHIGEFRGAKWYNKQLDKIRSKRDKCKKKSRRYIHLSKVYKRVSQKKRDKQRDCLHKASHLIAHKLVERTVVIGNLSQRQMVMKEHTERNKHLNRAVYNDWGLYTFVQMLVYKCLLYGKELVYLDETLTSKTCSGCEYISLCFERQWETMPTPILLVPPTINAIVIGLFTGVILHQYLTRHRIYQLYWSIALGMAFLATVSYIVMLFVQPTSETGILLFRLYYILGGTLMPAWLGMGSIALGGGLRMSRICFSILLLLSLIGTAFVLDATINMSQLAHVAGTSGTGILQPGPSLVLTILLNTLGVVAIVGIAIYSGIKLLQRQAHISGTRTSNVLWANILILIGALLNAAAGSLARILGIQSTFWLVMAAGWIVLFAGVLVASRRSYPVRSAISTKEEVAQRVEVKH